MLWYYKEGLDCFCLTEQTRCTPDIECIWLTLRLVYTRLKIVGLIHRSMDRFVEHIEDICFCLRSQRNCEINLWGTLI